MGRGRKDFGKGFYMAVSKIQAVGMMHKKYREAIRRSRSKQETAFSEKLYEIELDEQMISREYCLTILRRKTWEYSTLWESRRLQIS